MVGERVRNVGNDNIKVVSTEGTAGLKLAE